ncbi:molybdate ABC transporter substrate-binding protein [Mycolicibacterium litorale]|uniref:molybdate ABC transporter substrate-binding protein n=1 Tax=Mycolicibacterium litorale TaxID=758802 RepID=UPI003CF87DF6
MSRLLGVVLLVAALCACTRQSAPEDTLMVFAAASLKQAFTAIGERFEADHPGTDVEFSFAGSSDLVTQLTQGAPADLFASADTRNMDRAAAAGLLDGAPVPFATNRLTIVVAEGNPKRVASLRDLARPGMTVVLCAAQVPCGAASRAAERAAGVELRPVSEETAVTDVLNKVMSGQADAGLVYVTDVLAAEGAVSSVDIPEAADAVNTYPIAALAQSEKAGSAAEFVDTVTGAVGQDILREAGFGPP